MGAIQKDRIVDMAPIAYIIFEQMYLDKNTLYANILVTSPSGLCGNTRTLEGVLFQGVSTKWRIKASKPLMNR